MRHSSVERPHSLVPPATAPLTAARATTARRSARRDGRFWTLLCALSLVAAFGCSGGTGCGGCGSPLTKPIKFPIENGIQLRVTQSGFDFIEQNLRPILSSLLPSGLNFCVPGQCGGYGFDIPSWAQFLFGLPGHVELVRYGLCHNADGSSCAAATPHHDGICADGCQLSMAIQEFDIRPNNTTDTLQIYMRLSQIATALEVKLRSDFVSTPGSCRVNVTSNSLPITADLQLRIDPATRRLTFGENLNTQIDLSNLDLRINVSGNLEICDPWGIGLCISDVCSLINGLVSFINVADIRNLILGFAQGPISTAVNSFADSLRCVSCQNNTECRSGSTCQGGKCVFTGGASAGRCVPLPLGTEAELDAGSFVQSFSPGNHAILRYAAYAGGFVDVVQNGVTTGMITGADSEPNTCVPDATPPSANAVPRATVLDGNFIPCNPGETACTANPTPYKAGVAVSERLFNHLFYSIYRSGLLCLNVGSELSEFLSTDNFALFLPSLSKLTGGKNRPMLLQVRPTASPVVTLGQGRLRRDAAGALVLDANGLPQIEDPLITLRIPDLKLTFHAQVDDRLVKLFDITVDVVLPLGIYFKADGSLAPLAGDLRAAFTNTRVSQSAILKEAPDALASVIDIALQQALPFLVSGLENASFQIPSVQGFQLVLDDRRLKTFESGTPAHKFVGLFSELQFTSMRMARGPLHVSAQLTGLDVPRAETYKSYTPQPGQRLPRATATIEMTAQGAATEELEFGYRLDQGAWSLFTPSRRITVESPLLLLQGTHEIEVRARHKEHQTWLTQEPARVKVVVDTLAPLLKLIKDDRALRFDARDTVTPKERLQYAVKVNHGSWSDYSSVAEVELQTLPAGANRIEVKVKDEAGNESTETRVMATHGRTTGSAGTTPGCGGAGCGATGSQAGAGAMGLLAVLGAALLLLRRRLGRARGALLLCGLLAMTLLASACSDSGAGIVEPTPVRCGSDTDCQPGEKCLVDSGLCVPGGGCRTDADCGPGRYCAEDLDGDGRRDCAFKRCTTNDECRTQVSCTGVQTAFCRDGACGCGEPCNGACPDGKFCCLTSNACTDVPMACVLACQSDSQCSSFGSNGRCVSGQCACADGYRLDVRAEGTVDNKTCSLAGASCACAENPALPVGDNGRWSNATTSQGALWVSAYNTTYGDLVVGKYDNQAATFTWWFVDGIPASPVVGAPSGPRGGVSEPGADVGTDTRIAAGPNGTLHVSYHDVTNGKLKYARGTPGTGGTMAFVSHVVDAAGTNGRYTSLVLDADGKPAISYMTLDIVDGAAHKSRARLARASSAAPSAASDWALATLHEVALPVVPCGGSCPGGQVCAQGAGNAYACTATSTTCTPACGATQACVGTACAAIYKPSTLTGLPEGTGLFNSLALGPDGRLWNAFHDRTHGNLVLVAINGAAVSAPQIVDGQNAQGVDTGDVGQWAALAIAADGKRHITYVNATTDELWHVVLDGNAATARVIDTGLRTTSGEPIGPNNPSPQSDPTIGGEHLVGDDSRIVAEPGGALRVAYMDSTELDLMYAKLNPATNQWTIETLAGNGELYTGAYGFHVSHLLDGNRYRIVNYKFDLRNDASGLDVRYAP